MRRVTNAEPNPSGPTSSGTDWRVVGASRTGRSPPRGRGRGCLDSEGMGLEGGGGAARRGLLNPLWRVDDHSPNERDIWAEEHGNGQVFALWFDDSQASA